MEAMGTTFATKLAEPSPSHWTHSLSLLKLPSTRSGFLKNHTVAVPRLSCRLLTCRGLIHKVSDGGGEEEEALPRDEPVLPELEVGSNNMTAAGKEMIPPSTGANSATGSGSRAGLFRTPLSGGVHSATSAHDLPPPALAVRNLMEQARFAHLCTVMSRKNHRRAGYPFGSLVDFAADTLGHPLFSLSPLAIHTRNLLEDSRCTLVVQIPGWSGLSNARVTIFGDVFPVPVDKQKWRCTYNFLWPYVRQKLSLQLFSHTLFSGTAFTKGKRRKYGSLVVSNAMDFVDWARQLFIPKHHQWASQQWGNFYYYRMETISDVYFIGGFGTVQWIDVREYEDLRPDKIAADGGEQSLKELNAIFSKPLREILSAEGEIDDAALISIDSRGTDIRVRQGAQFNIQRLSFEVEKGVDTLEEAKKALQKIIKQKMQLMK